MATKNAGIDLKNNAHAVTLTVEFLNSSRWIFNESHRARAHTYILVSLLKVR